MAYDIEAGGLEGTLEVPGSVAWNSDYSENHLQELCKSISGT